VSLNAGIPGKGQANDPTRKPNFRVLKSHGVDAMSSGCDEIGSIGTVSFKIMGEIFPAILGFEAMFDDKASTNTFNVSFSTYGSKHLCKPAACKVDQQTTDRQTKH
jgi:hypothetical protein